MTVQIKKRPPALNHAGYSATSILPGESEAEFGKLHRELISELTPNGVLEDDIVAAIAHLVWRRRNLVTFRIAEIAQQRVNQLRDAMVPGIDVQKSDESVEFESTFIEKCQAAEKQARTELGEQYALVEMGEEATVDCLMKGLDVQERLDAMIDRCLKRLLMVRGLKSMFIGSTSASPKSLPNPGGQVIEAD
jgi:hypothetical protein